jgi:hypothetical protein
MRLSLASILAFVALARCDSQASFTQPANKGKNNQLLWSWTSRQRCSPAPGDQLLSSRCLNGLGTALVRSAPIILDLLAMGSFKVRVNVTFPR